jgi:integrating conjugative element protein (TIGR03759 family)
MINKRVAMSGCALVSGLVLAMSLPSIAQNNTATEQQRTDTHPTRIGNTKVDPVDSVRAQYWDLNGDDWQRYRTLMQGIRGSISSPNLTPIEVLGIHARTAQERRRYAEQWAMIMREDAERILAFQHAYDEAQQRLFPHDQLIDAVKLAMHQSKPKTAVDETLGSNDRVLFFTTSDCVACDAVLDRLLGKLPTIDGLDIYLLDVAPGNEDLIREWAGRIKIDPDWVRERRITLNVDAGALDKLAVTLGGQLDQRPVVLRRRGDAVLPLSSSRF